MQRSIYQSIGQWIEESINREINRSIDRWIGINHHSSLFDKLKKKFVVTLARVPNQPFARSYLRRIDTEPHSPALSAKWVAGLEENQKKSSYWMEVSSSRVSGSPRANWPEAFSLLTMTLVRKRGKKEKKTACILYLYAIPRSISLSFLLSYLTVRADERDCPTRWQKSIPTHSHIHFPPTATHCSSQAHYSEESKTLEPTPRCLNSEISTTKKESATESECFALYVSFSHSLWLCLPACLSFSLSLVVWEVISKAKEPKKKKRKLFRFREKGEMSYRCRVESRDI